jgi:hypothetical protein
MGEDPFETVAIAYRQPQAMVMLSMFHAYGIPAYAKNFGHVSVASPVTLALGGIPIRVHRDYAEEARDMLAEAAERGQGEAPAMTQSLEERLIKVPALLLMMLMGTPPSPRLSATIVPR